MTGLRIAITGATGFLGRHTLPILARQDVELVVLGRRPIPEFAFHEWSAEPDPQCVAPALAGVHTVIHMAAHVPTHMRDPAEAAKCLEVNALGTLALAQAATAAGVARFVLVSSANVVERRADPIPDNAYPARHHLHAPYYLTSKLLAETYIGAMQSSDLETLILRPSAIYGPNGPGNVLTAFLGKLRRNEPVRIGNAGRHSADYVFVTDVADLLARAALSNLQGFLNAGSGAATDLLTVLQLARERVPDTTSEIHVEEPIADQPLPGFSALDITRAREAFAYRPRTLRKGLACLLA